MTEPVKEMEIVCSQCGTAQKSKPTAKEQPRLPRGWKRWDEKIWCGKCWQERWQLRAITVPIAGLVGMEWVELRKRLAEQWNATTRLANWTIRELAKREPARTADMEKMPAMERIYLYPEARQLAPELGTATTVSILQAVERKYRARRYHTAWLCKESLPSMRYPVPCPVHNQAWKIAVDDDGGALLLSVLLGAGRITLRLRGGPGFRAAREVLVRVAAGEYAKGELAIFQKPASNSRHRPGGVGHSPTAVMAKMIVWLPRKQARGQRGTLHVRTSGESLLVYHVDQGEIKYYHADQVRRWVAEHRKKLDRLSDDTKYEKRWPARVRRGIAERREKWCRKQNNRLDSFCHQTSAMIAGFAERVKVEKIEYDDTDKSFCESFPWGRLRDMIVQKLPAGVDFSAVADRSSGEEITQNGESLEE